MTWLSRDAIMFKGTVEQINQKYPTFFKAATNYIEDAERINKYLLDNPYCTEPFFNASPTNGMFPLKVEIIVNQFKNYLFYNSKQWSLQNDPEFREVNTLNLHQRYHRFYGYALENHETQD